ncbi:MAG: 50S ribosomal protein L11 methyltransferase [Deltaproteobacteria bacterium]|nr:50S ribosomal protein L11 methyltransferase [Deltaproteobacteria bacterium]
MQRDWIEVKAVGPRLQKDAAVWVLVEAGSPGVVEADDGLPLPFAVSHSALGVDAPESMSADAAFTAYLPVESAAALPVLGESLRRFGWSISCAPYAHSDWAERWKRSIRPVRITVCGRSIVIKPTWRTVKKRPRDIVIEIDPGMAFGTGSHATTKTCLKAMLMLIGKKIIKPRKSAFLDVGTGTGILAIAAVKLGFIKAAGTDIDPEAIRVARENIRLNKATVSLSTKPLEAVRGGFGCVAANILGNDLHRLGPALAAKTAAGGFIILSGLLVHERAGLIEAYAALGFKKVKTYLSGEWATLVLVKRV